MGRQYTLERGGGQQLLDLLPEITELYLSIRAEPPYDSSPLYHRDAFLDRTRTQSQHPGFEIVWAVDTASDLVGFAFGLPFPEHGWWSGSGSAPPADILAAAKFAVIELDVRKDHRRRGLGRRLLNDLLADRLEPYAILTTRPDVAARELYRQLGWRQTGTTQHTPDSPVFDQLAIALPLATPSMR